ncbi:BamA/TamA family outer membrane protein [Cytophagaceae bacterium YF14B1]|uniref:BamA/TamA family outer membrane protein n=1 Tax=Xanthocytophaga flava TaxID=3048013 RepID=A0AAE3U9Q6_9BACT|nr:BamA/TamA family outer membrane protein [Xanthocytophaga flavus]MDJ1483932.1 BamA/TamA family outer membrane protein [Xanthocytophaga flavus]
MISPLWLFILPGCVSQEKVIKPGQSLLYSQHIKGNTKVSATELESFYKQRANRRWLNLPIYPYLYLYRLGLRTYDQAKVEKEINEEQDRYTQKVRAAGTDSIEITRIERKHEKRLNRLNRQLIEGNWLMRKGEPPVAFDSTLARKTTEQMQNYLQSKGFFRSNVHLEYITDTLQRSRVTYSIVENQRYFIRKAIWVTTNVKIDSLLNANAPKTYIKINEGYDGDKVLAERDRIDKLLKDNGYYSFSKQYIKVVLDTIPDSTQNIDSTLRNNYIFLKTIINNPPDGSTHKVYVVDDVYFTEDAATRGRGQRDTILFNGIHYLSRNHRFSRKIVNSKILIRPHTPYSQQKSIETQQLFGNLDIFKFANIYYDTTGGKFNARIYASPLDRFSYSVEAGGTVTLANGYPGPFGSTIFKVRNIFGGLEVFELRATGSVEGVAGFISEGNNSILSSQQLSLTSSLTFPQILIPGKIKYFFSPYLPQTRVSVGYNLTNRPDFRRYGFKGTFSYLWQPQPQKQFNVTVLEISRIFSDYTKNPAGEALKNEILDLKSEGSTLWRAFQKAFVSSINASYTYSTSNNLRQKAQYLRLFAESGGLFLFVPQARDVIGITQSDSTGEGLQFYRFIKLNADYRFFIPSGRQSTWAFRINTGFANPYGPAGTLPYEKFFFAGGSNSIRAWSPRRLGLGSSPDSVDAKGNYTYKFEQPGDIILEASVEYRTPLVKFSNFNIGIAFFADAGNVWLLRKDKTIPNGEFAIDRFYKEIAVGSGMGLRFDFSFLIVRFDFGTKVYDPGRRPADRWAVTKIFGPKSFFAPGQSTINFGIGYPF